MQVAARRWLALLGAAVLLLGGASPAPSRVDARAAVAAGSAGGHDRPAPDGVVRLDALDRSERGGIGERPAGDAGSAATPAAARIPDAGTRAAPARAARAAAGALRTRAPPGDAAPFPS